MNESTTNYFKHSLFERCIMECWDLWNDGVMLISVMASFFINYEMPSM